MVISETMTAIKDYNVMMEQKENSLAMERNREGILESISERNNENL